MDAITYPDPPRNLDDVLRIAIEDMKATIEREDFSFNVDIWLSPSTRSNKPLCFGCVAGAVMFNRFDVEDLFYFDVNLPEEKKYWTYLMDVLDDIRDFYPEDNMMKRHLPHALEMFCNNLAHNEGIIITETEQLEFILLHKRFSKIERILPNEKDEEGYLQLFKEFRKYYNENKEEKKP